MTVLNGDSCEKQAEAYIRRQIATKQGISSAVVAEILGAEFGDVRKFICAVQDEVAPVNIRGRPAI